AAAAAAAPAPPAPACPPAHPFGGIPRAALPVGLAVLLCSLAAGWWGRRVEFDYNLLHLQSPAMESVAWEWRLIRSENRSSFCASLVRDRAELEALRTRYRACAGVVQATDALFPEDEEVKRALLTGLAAEVGNLDIAPAAALRLPSFKREVAGLRQVLRSYIARDERAERFLAPVAAALGRLLTTAESVDPARLQARLEAFEAEFLACLRERFATLRGLLRPGEVKLGALPPELERRFVGTDGRLALLVYPAKNVWEFAEMEEFARAVRGVDATAVGAPIQIYESHKLFVRAFAQTVLLSTIAILLLLYGNFRSLGRTLVAASPLALGIALLLGGMRALGMPFNFANFFAVPILIGSGVDIGVHLVHAYSGAADAATVRGTYRGVTLSSLTTILGFGTLFTAQHVGLAGLGTLLTVGSAILLVVSLLFVPALIAVGRRLGLTL
ncbi:MAG: hypothetical protein HZA54_11425, partial [Planctomycetes bacterium]|nr:hypothetical protein [Planctomycetota bacterium]